MDRPRFKTQLTRLDDHEAQAAFDRVFWREAGPAAIWDAAVQMKQEYYFFKGLNPDDAVFQRTVTNLQRGRN
jgi:hypothetical protein